MYKLKLKSKPISTNSAYYKRNRAFNENTRKWRANFFKELMRDSNQQVIENIKKSFNPDKHALRVVFIWHQPRDILFTNSGNLSLRSMDVDNCLKIPTDCLFDQKYNDTWLSKRTGKEVKLYSDLASLNNLSLNDKFIFDTRSIKLPSDDTDFHLLITIEIVETKNFRNLIIPL